MIERCFCWVTYFKVFPTSFSKNLKSWNGRLIQVKSSILESIFQNFSQEINCIFYSVAKRINLLLTTPVNKLSPGRFVIRNCSLSSRLGHNVGRYIIIKPEKILFFKPKQIFRQKRCYVGQGEFQTGHQTKLF